MDPDKPTGSTLFEELGLYYIGPVDGHNFEDIVCVLQENRDTETGKHIVVQDIRTFRDCFVEALVMEAKNDRIYCCGSCRNGDGFITLYISGELSKQMVHYLDMQRKAVRNVITSAGLVGSDGPVQCGAFELASVSSLPKMIATAPADEDDLYIWLRLQLISLTAKFVFRFPKGGIVNKNYLVPTGLPIEVNSNQSLNL